MNIYISKNDVIDSINYFKNLGLSTDDSLFLFLLSKHMGITIVAPVTYGGSMSTEKKQECLSAIWMMAGLFDSTEECAKRGLMFPTGFAKPELYQPGTEFNGAVGRVRDTIKQKNVIVQIYNNNDFVLTLKGNYRDLIKENYLQGKKISLSALSAWIFRFTSFEFDTFPTPKQFARVLEKVVRKFLKISKNDFLWLFEDDLSTKRLSPNSIGITGAEVRNEFPFDPAKMPEVQPITPTFDAQQNIISQATVDKYLALNGDNPSDDDIFDILKTKKQIVLTGVPGVGKSRYTDILCNNPFFYKNNVIQFHASYGYEDFIGSETLEPTSSGGTQITTRKGTFLEFIEEAKNDPDKTHNYLFVIDELNRGNIAEIFGETILALDRSYKVVLRKTYDGVKELQIPENVYIVGTMNTSDRNIAFLDLAIRRRFAFIPLLPNYDFLSEEVVLDSFDLGNVLKTINQRIVNVLNDPELILGQAYFIPPKTSAGTYEWTIEQFKNQFNFVVLPTLKEYGFNDPALIGSIVGESLCDGEQEIDDFRAAFTAEFDV